MDNDGLVYLRARYYDPASGRFMSRDPVAGSAGLPLSLNRFTYVQNNPGLNADPSGRCGPACAVLAAGACATDPVCLAVVGLAGLATLSIVGVSHYLQQRPLDGPSLQGASAADAGSPAGPGMSPTPQPGGGGEVTLADVARLRHDLGLPARGAPGDRYTVAILQADDTDIYGISAHGTDVTYPVDAISESHAETDALNQLVQLRSRTGAVAGTARLVVDRPPCPACSTFGGIRAGVRAAGLDELQVEYPGGTLMITP